MRHVWNTLQREIEELAAKQADEAGFVAGVLFTDSKGARQLEPGPGTANLVDIALGLYKKYRAEADIAA